jgi:hypothetical protein
MAEPSRGVTGPASYFAEAHRKHRDAQTACGGSVERYHEIARHTVRLSFAGPALVRQLTPAFAHLATEPVASPNLTVLLFDTASTGVAMPPPPWPLAHVGAGGAIRGWSEGRYRAVLHNEGPGLSLLDRDQRTGVFWTRDAATLPGWMTAAPLKSILHAWTGACGLQLTHTAAVGPPTGGVILAGKGGSGKSTIALACLLGGLPYAADDYCIVDPGPPVGVFSLYATGKQLTGKLGRVPDLVSRVVDPASFDGAKAIFFLAGHYPEKLVRGFPLRAVLIPRLTGEQGSHRSPASAATALTALAPSTMFQMSGDRRTALARLGAVVRQVPSYHLDVGTDLAQVVRLIGELIARGESP